MSPDSALCRAAVHAGVIEPSGGKVTVYPLPGQLSYDGQERNGVTSGDYGRFGGSFAFRADVAPQAVRCLSENLAEGKPVTCRCRAADAAGSNIWGTDVYTRDSSICVAAVHAGLIQRSGGAVTVVAEPGRDSYAGSERNGVTSGSYGRFSGSFSFQK